jgi:general secretion pathway protein K
MCGAALVVALLAVSIVTLLAVALASDFLLLFRRVENQLRAEQADSYLRGAEGVARAVLLQDGQGGNPRDSFDEPWHDELHFVTDFGWIAGRLEDMQGRFNLNNLAQRGTTPKGQLTSAQKQLIRLLQTLPLQERLQLDEAQALVEAITDWIDSDDEVTGFGGAESDYYADLEPAAGRAANRPLAAPSELRWVRGMTPEIYRALAPLVTVWPAEGGSVNINTAPPQVLASINVADELSPLAESDLDALLQARGEIGFDNVDAAFAAPPFAGRQFDLSQLGIASDWFMLHAETELAGRRYRATTLLRRNGDREVQVIARSFGEW